MQRALQPSHSASSMPQTPPPPAMPRRESTAANRSRNGEPLVTVQSDPAGAGLKGQNTPVVSTNPGHQQTWIANASVRELHSRNDIPSSAGSSESGSDEPSQLESVGGYDAFPKPRVSSLPVPSGIPSQLPPPRHDTSSHFQRPLHSMVGFVSLFQRYPPQSGFYAAPPTSDTVSSDQATRSSVLGGERQEIWGKLEAQRRKIRRLRAERAEKRHVLRVLQGRKDNADNGLMQALRPHLTSPTVASVPVHILQGHIAKMDRIREEYYAAQDALEILEAEHDHEEARLGILERELVLSLRSRAVGVHLAPSFMSSGPSESSSGDDESTGPEGDTESLDLPSRVPLKTSLLGISAGRPQDIHPLYRELLDAVGDRELAEEHCDELRAYYDEIVSNLELEVHKRRVRNNESNLITEESLAALRLSIVKALGNAATLEAQLGVTLDEDDLEFLDDYEVNLDQAKQSLAEATQRVEQLRELCIQKGAMPKNVPYDEERAIFDGSSHTFDVMDDNLDIERSIAARNSLAHPRFSILLSNPSHVLELRSPSEALDRAMELPTDDPAYASRRGDCIKEFGISNLLKSPENTPDFINKWLIHRLRTSPLEVLLMLNVTESFFKVVNLHRWQQEVLSHWRLDDAAKLSPSNFHGPRTPKDELDLDDECSSVLQNSAIEELQRARTEDGITRLRRHGKLRSVKSFA